MAGIYLHIPFCKQACSYCDFHFSTNLKRQGEMVQAMQQEIELRNDFFQEKDTIQTIYFGGGTPSILKPEEIARLLASIHAQFEVSEQAEISLEANPDNMSSDNLHAWRALGINRLSVGIQSFRQQDMAWMRRSHSVAQAQACLTNARTVGFDNLSLDLIFGGPSLSLADWQANVEQLISFAPEHVALYALTVEEKTMLHHWVQREQLEPVTDEVSQQQFLLAHELMTAAGYEHYEVSSFAKAGFRSRHNSAYWQGIAYLGIGPSAHSYRSQERSWNIANNFRYIQSLRSKQSPTAETEQLSLTDRYHEYIMTGLRRVEGIDLLKVKQEFGVDFQHQFRETLAEIFAAKQMWLVGSQLGFTPAGWIISDEIISRFF